MQNQSKEKQREENRKMYPVTTEIIDYFRNELGYPKAVIKSTDEVKLCKQADKK